MSIKKRRANPVNSAQSIPRAEPGQLCWLCHVIPFPTLWRGDEHPHFTEGHFGAWRGYHLT